MTAPGRVFNGKLASHGYAHGPLVWAGAVAVDRRRPSDDEEGALRAALAAATKQIAGLAEAAGHEAADILEFQIALLDDESFLEPVFTAIAAGAAAEVAWSQALDKQIAAYRAAPDEYLRARAADFADLRDRVVAALNGGAAAPSAIPAGAIVCAEDLPPSRFLEIDWSKGGGLALAKGSPTSHVAMLARARGVPMVVQLGGALPEAAAAALLDGDSATLEVDPPTPRIAAFEARRSGEAERKAAVRAALVGPALAWRGEPLKFFLNIQSAADLDHSDAEYADGVGLMRTEFLFGDPAGLPDEEKQRIAYEAVLRWAGDRPVTIRTVDAGGDKPIRGFTEDGEANPFLGVRGLRLCMKRPDVFAVQLRALARAAVGGKLKVMFPMVTAPSEFMAARAPFERTVKELKAAGVPAALPELGIMVEVPAAALTIDAFRASFFSIGSNDLTQYVTACDRSNGALGALADPLNPGVVELIRRVVEHGRRRGVSVSLCGDMAGEPRYVAELLRSGLREFSMATPSLARVKHAIAGLGPEASFV
jgi:phosphoenolpyruvate-protein phosphotransferase (PTS system enzyme I)